MASFQLKVSHRTVHVRRRLLVLWGPVAALAAWVFGLMSGAGMSMAEDPGMGCLFAAAWLLTGAGVLDVVHEDIEGGEA